MFLSLVKFSSSPKYELLTYSADYESESWLVGLLCTETRRVESYSTWGTISLSKHNPRTLALLNGTVSNIGPVKKWV